MTKCKRHSWETPVGLVDGVPTRGIRRCSVCGYTPKTQRQPLPKDAVLFKKEKLPPPPNKAKQEAVKKKLKGGKK